MDLLRLIVVPQLSGSCLHNYSTKTRQAGCAVVRYMYSLMAVPKQLSKELHLHRHLISLNIDTNGLYLLSDLKIYFLSKGFITCPISRHDFSLKAYLHVGPILH
jgi:hypothetical protein